MKKRQHRQSHKDKLALRLHLNAALGVFFLVINALWPIAHAQAMASKDPLSRVLCAGQLYAPITIEARITLQKLAALSGDDSFLPDQQQPTSPCQGCFFAAQNDDLCASAHAQWPIRIACVTIVAGISDNDLLRPSACLSIAQARAPPHSLIFT